jgi:redox-sensing transcriptional repressor
MNDHSDKPSEKSPEEKGNDTGIPKAVVNRLSLYLRELQHLIRNGKETTSSTQLGKVLGFTDAQVRKDLAYFGQFGHPGVGYRCHELISAIKSILGTDRNWPVAMIGLGNLGQALLGYRGFQNQGFDLVAGFDTDERLINREFGKLSVFHLDRFEEITQDRGIKLAIIAVPAAAAQQVAEHAVAAGVEGVLNFAPVTLTLPPHISVVGVDLTIELEQLTFAVVNSRQNT